MRKVTAGWQSEKKVTQHSSNMKTYCKLIAQFCSNICYSHPIKWTSSPSASIHWTRLFSFFSLVSSFLLCEQYLSAISFCASTTCSSDRVLFLSAHQHLLWLPITDAEFRNPIHTTIFIRYCIKFRCNIIFFSTLTTYWYDSSASSSCCKIAGMSEPF